MNPFNFLAGGAILGVIAGMWAQIKTVSWKIISLFIEQIEIPCSQAHSAIVAHLVKTYRRSRLYDRMYAAAYFHYRDGRYGLVPYEMFGSRSIVFWDGWWPFVFSNPQENQKGTNNNNNGQQANNTARVYSTITSLRWTISVEAILVKACANLNQLTWNVTNNQEETRNRFAIHYAPERESSDAKGFHRNESGLQWSVLSARSSEWCS